MTLTALTFIHYVSKLQNFNINLWKCEIISTIIAHQVHNKCQTVS